MKNNTEKTETKKSKITRDIIPCKERTTPISGETQKARYRVVLGVAFLVFAVIIGRLAYLQLVNDEYRNRALNQYTGTTVLTASRGKIYDKNMNELAYSTTVYTVSISPKNIKTEEERIIIADILYEVLDIDREFILEKMRTANVKYYTVKKQVDMQKANEIEDYIELVRIKTASEKNNGGIVLKGKLNLQMDSKRYYPYGTLAAHTIGVVGNTEEKGVTGIFGIEYTYESLLKGIDGREITATDATGNALPFKYGTIVDPQNGSNLVLTLDVTVQSILEKYLKEAYEDNNPNNKVAGIIMDVNTGAILGSAVYPAFDLNDYKTLSAEDQAKLDSYVPDPTDPNALTKSEYQVKLMTEMWNNKVAMEPYEPGSTFKIFTAAVALEEAIATIDDSYYCSGSIKIDGVAQPIHCHKGGGHKDQTFAQTLQNSCNPAFVQWGHDIGKATFVKYYEEFGYFSKTGSDVYGEATTLSYNNLGGQFEQLELAVYSFGQTFKTTMLQQIRAMSAVANGGNLVTPHLLESIVDDKGNVLKTFEYETVRQVLSESTCDTIMKILAEGVSMGSTKNAAVSGYSVAAKTGTSEKRDTEEEDYISSCIAFAPAENPQIAILIIVDDPTAGEYYGGLVAAPVVSKVLTEVLPYLGIPKSGEETAPSVSVADYRGGELNSVIKLIENSGLNYVVVGDGNSVIEQTPKFGNHVIEGSTVYLYTDTNCEKETVTVPSLVRKTPDEIIKKVNELGLNLCIVGSYNKNISGTPKSISQSIEAGETVEKGTVIEVEFKYTEGIDG